MSDANTPGHETDPAASSHNARIGMILFVIYVILYGGFMGISAFKYELMSSTPFGGVNLAVLYGFGLILAAFVLAAAYMLLARK